MKDSLKYFLMGMGSIFKGFSRIFTDPFCIKLNREYKEIREILEEKHANIQNIFEEIRVVVDSKPINWDEYEILGEKLIKAQEDYENFANKYIRKQWRTL